MSHHHYCSLTHWIDVDEEHRCSHKSCTHYHWEILQNKLVQLIERLNFSRNYIRFIDKGRISIYSKTLINKLTLYNFTSKYYVILQKSRFPVRLFTRIHTIRERNETYKPKINGTWLRTAHILYTVQKRLFFHYIHANIICHEDMAFFIFCGYMLRICGELPRHQIR